MLVKKDGTTSSAGERKQSHLPCYLGRAVHSGPTCLLPRIPATFSLNQITGRGMLRDFLDLCHRK